MVRDPVSDMFARIKNAQMARHPLVSLPYSKLKFGIAKILEFKKFVGNVSVKGKKNKRGIDIVLIYGAEGLPKISEIKPVSKQSRRVYRGWREIKPPKSGLGSYIISSTDGIIDDQKAKKSKVGGEILGVVW